MLSGNDMGCTVRLLKFNGTCYHIQNQGAYIFTYFVNKRRGCSVDSWNISRIPWLYNILVLTPSNIAWTFHNLKHSTILT